MISEIPEGLRHLFPLTSQPFFGPEMTPPGEVAIVEVRSNYSEFLYRVVFIAETLSCFEVNELSLRSWGEAARILWRRRHGLSADASVDELNELISRSILPARADLSFCVRNVSDAPHCLRGAILSCCSALERRADLLRNCSSDRRPLDHASSWWKERHQRIADLSEEEAIQIDAKLSQCADGSPRRNLRIVVPAVDAARGVDR